MREIQITQFTADDGRLMKRLYHQFDEIPDDVFEQALIEYENKGPAWAFWDDKRLVWCAGVIQFWPGSGEGWMMPPDNARVYWRELHYYTLLFLEEVGKASHFERIQARISTESLPARRFVERLGFEKEGLMRKMGPGSADFYLYARIR